MWWKVIAVILVFYTIIAGLLIPVPALPILNESIRNTFFHIPMWFSMMILMTVSLVSSVRYLSGFDMKKDHLAAESANVALFMGVLGLLTGMIWAQYTWGTFWTNDVKLNGTAISMLVYLAYLVLRNSIEEEQKRAKVAAVYNIFAYVMMMLFIMVLPRLTDSLHPGNGGNPAFGEYDMDSTMRMVFYPAVIGWTLLGVWFIQLRMRLNKIKNHLIYE
ncbi:MAG: cytochrome c biogenesis protein CcsA [Flavobacteriales bacterium]|nr:cytochrome c biogenesis protein CcsA [Flavobacteriales bacterium]